MGMGPSGTRRKLPSVDNHGVGNVRVAGFESASDVHLPLPDGGKPGHRIPALACDRVGDSVLDGGADDGLRITAVWDIETTDWDRFVCGALWREGIGVEIFKSEDDMGEALATLPKGTQVWAHAGGRFDVLWWLDWNVRKHGRVPDAKLSMSGSSISKCAIKDGPVFRDSFRLIPMSLAKASTMFGGGQTKQRLDLPCVCGDNCGGYCSITHHMPAKLERRLKDYLCADIESLRDTLAGLLTYSARNNIKLAGTLAGTTWKTAKERCGLENAEWTIPEYRFIRSGYYGGRVEVARTFALRCWNYDRTQAYPSAMCGPLPTGVHRSLPALQAHRAFLSGKPGFYEAVVEIPDSLAPTLPSRHGVRLVYPWGLIGGVWARDELNHAEECGAKIKNISKAVVWMEESPILRDYMQSCFEAREAAPTDALRTWEKLRANSLSGAFAQDPDKEIIAFGDYADDPHYEQVGRYPWIWRRSVYRIPDRGHIHYAGTLTADARVELHREIEHAGEDWCYSDTDSVKAGRPLTRNVGAGLGLWKFEGTWRDAEFIAPKVYNGCLELPEGHQGPIRRETKAKGITSQPNQWEAIRNREEIAIEAGVESFLVAARGERLFKKRKTTRRLKEPTEWVGGRIRCGNERTRAPNVKELGGLPA